MKVVSINVGLPPEVEWKGITVTTGIFKEPVTGSVAVRRDNLDGDGQADLTVHGGTNKAVYGYASEHYPYWRKQYPSMELSWGVFGENLTTEGVSEDSLHIGDVVRVGSAVLRVVQPRQPWRVAQPLFLIFFTHSGRRVPRPCVLCKGGRFVP